MCQISQLVMIVVNPPEPTQVCDLICLLALRMLFKV